MFTQTIAAILALPFVAQLVSADMSCTRTYTAQAGDICDSISAANSVSTYQLAVVNTGIIDEACDNLVVGQSYCLGWQGQDCTTTYVVKAGDDCYGISYAAGTNTTILYANNPQINEDCTNIYVGEVPQYFSVSTQFLKVSFRYCAHRTTVQVPAPPASGTTPATSIPATATPANPDGDLPWCDE
ncbi:uncharacterized protein EDB91DRAFT_1164030 [Suillus paluster]|uniref:uncharacterized protein n=1 Tax=Suillus paluster TaxID=48578 RepID=UPI001B85D927|nr:uncharacterized protein EDB91DRAFT_1164030 [Suillus paluster]KAG1727484.1 hypothetical protein EDB91DRAFT_1164030 [Suillus paluster]